MAPNYLFDTDDSMNCSKNKFYNKAVDIFARATHAMNACVILWDTHFSIIRTVKTMVADEQLQKLNYESLVGLIKHGELYSSAIEQICKQLILRPDIEKELFDSYVFMQSTTSRDRILSAESMKIADEIVAALMKKCSILFDIITTSLDSKRNQ